MTSIECEDCRYCSKDMQAGCQHTTYWLLALMGVTGAVLNCKGVYLQSFGVWMASNSGLMVLAYIRREQALSVLFGVYLLTSIWGLVRCLM